MTKSMRSGHQFIPVILVLAVLGAPSGYSQAPEAAARTVLPELVVTATRLPTEIASIPGMVHGLNPAQQLEQGARTTPDLLGALPSIMVQKTAYGQGSPYIRGFTGFRTLLLVDGVRLNHSAFRDGPNQYGNTVDPFSIERVEVVMGPASVLYGSDAIGGAVNLLPVTPPPYDGAPVWTHRWQYRGSTAEDSHSGRLQIGARPVERFGFVLGTTAKRFGDLRGGAEVGRQPRTGYDERDVDLRAEYSPDAHTRLMLGHQSVRMDDAWRTHRTLYGIEWEGTSRGDDKVHRFDQERDLTYVRLMRYDVDGLIDGLQVTLSRHAQREDRFRVRGNDDADRQGFDVTTWGVTLQLDAPSRSGHWVSGFDVYQDRVGSYAHTYAEDGTVAQRRVQGPVADDAFYTIAGLFLQNTLSPGSWDLVPGVRYSYARTDARSVEARTSGERLTVKRDWHAVVGSLRVLRALTPDRRRTLFAGVSQGFRAPNLSDLTRFDISRSGEIETPTVDLDPERYLSYEIGLKSQGDRLRSQIALYRTDIDGMITRTPTGRTIEGYPEVTKRNAGQGYVQGVEIVTDMNLGANVSARFAGSIMDGKVDTYPTSEAVLQRDTISRLMPPTAHAGLRWTSSTGRWWLESAVDMAARADRLSDGDRRDTQRIPPGGTPGYSVFHVRYGQQLTEHLLLTLGLENLLDTDYRIHGSGINEPGRGLLVNVTGAF